MRPTSEGDGAAMAARRSLFRWGVRLEWFTIGWNVIEAMVAVSAGIIAGSTALVAFGADSAVEIVSAVALLRRFKQAGPEADVAAHGAAERRALYLVALTFLLLGVYIAVESTLHLVRQEAPERSPVGLVLSIASLIIMPALALAKGSVGKQLGSKALQADAVETWVCAYLSLTLLAGLGLNHALNWWWADAAGALAMLPVVWWQAWETYEDARDEDSIPE